MRADPIRLLPLLPVVLCVSVSCGPGPEDAAAPTGKPAASAELLPTPFTAEQIRDEMPVGLRLTIRRVTPGGEELERWEVVAADTDGVEIEFTPTDPDGNSIGEARRTRSSWVELRDHASFSAASATREALRRDTALGELDGWLYRVRNPADGTTSEFFFARELPGAPVHVITTRGDELIQEMVQLERRRSE